MAGSINPEMNSICKTFILFDFAVGEGSVTKEWRHQTPLPYAVLFLLG